MSTRFPTVEEWTYGPYRRLLEVTGSESQSDLCEHLGIRQSSISDAKKRKSIPAEWLWTIWKRKMINPDWILDGHSPKFLWPVDKMPKDGEEPSPNDETLIPEERKGMPVHQQNMYDMCMACVIVKRLLVAEVAVSGAIAQHAALINEFVKLIGNNKILLYGPEEISDAES